MTTFNLKKNKFLETLLQPHIVGSILLVLVGLISYQSFILGPKTYFNGGESYTHYNNYIIFKQSYFHLLENKNLYIHFPKEQFDLYKYSPSFALFMAPLAKLPDSIGLFLWNFLNAFVLFWGFLKLSNISPRYRLIAFLIIIIELVTSLQNAQSNGLMAGLVILCFAFMEKRKYALATLLLVLSIYIKIFSLISISLLILYPKPLKSMLYFILWLTIFFLFPLLAISWDELIQQYINWGELLAQDESQSVGISVAGILESMAISIPKKIILLGGTVIYALPYIFLKRYKYLYFRILCLAASLIWVVIFNHKAESPTFVIAMAGIAIWHFSSRQNKLSLWLLLLALLFTSICTTDLIPYDIRKNIIEPYRLKVLFPIIIWCKVIYESVFIKIADKNQSVSKTTF